jgi:hypothetical protein
MGEATKNVSASHFAKPPLHRSRRALALLALPVLTNETAAILQQSTSFVDLFSALIDAGEEGRKTPTLEGRANDDLVGTGAIDFDMLKVGNEFFGDKDPISSLIGLAHGISPLALR